MKLNKNSKGNKLYKKAKNGEIKNFTGVTSVYESPENPDIKIDTTDLSIDQSIQFIYKKIKNKLNA